MAFDWVWDGNGFHFQEKKKPLILGYSLLVFIKHSSYLLAASMSLFQYFLTISICGWGQSLGGLSHSSLAPSQMSSLAESNEFLVPEKVDLCMRKMGAVKRPVITWSLSGTRDPKQRHWECGRQLEFRGEWAGKGRTRWLNVIERKGGKDGKEEGEREEEREVEGRRVTRKGGREMGRGKEDEEGKRRGGRRVRTGFQKSSPGLWGCLTSSFGLTFLQTSNRSYQRKSSLFSLGKMMVNNSFMKLW